MGLSCRFQSIRNRLLLHGLLSMGLQVLPGPCSRTSSPQAATSFLPTSICSGMGSSSSMGFCSTTVPHRLHQGTQMPHQGLLQGLQGNLCSRVWSTSCPFCIDVNVCGAASLTCHFSPPSHSCYTMSFFSNALPRGASILAGGLSCIVWWVCWRPLEWAGTAPVQHRTALTSPYRGCPAAPSARTSAQTPDTQNPALSWGSQWIMPFNGRVEHFDGANELSGAPSVSPQHQ